MTITSIITMTLAICTLSTAAIGAQDAAADASTGKIKAIVDAAAKTYMERPEAVGMSIGVYIDGKTSTYNYGTVERGKERRPTEKTIYPIASISKTFTGTMLAQAEIEKRASLDDDVRKYLDGDYPNLEYEGHPIRLGHLVNHNSGLPFNLPDIPENRPPFPTPSAATQAFLKSYDRTQFLADLHKVKLDRVPGEKFSYSNAAAVLASIVLETIYGMPYDEILKHSITGRLRMPDTALSLSRSQGRRLATGYGKDGHATSYPSDMLMGAGAIKSTVRDMLKYAQWELAEQDEVVKVTHRPWFKLSDTFSVGLNWQMLTSGDRRRVWQEGNLPGFVSMCMLFPELKIAIVVLVNEDDPESSHALGLMENEIVRGLDPLTSPLMF